MSATAIRGNALQRLKNSHAGEKQPHFERLCVKSNQLKTIDLLLQLAASF